LDQDRRAIWQPQLDQRFVAKELVSGNLCRQRAIGPNLDILGPNANANRSGGDAIVTLLW